MTPPAERRTRSAELADLLRDWGFFAPGDSLSFFMPVSRYAEIDARVLALLRERGPMTHRQIGDEVGVDREGARLSLSRLHQRHQARFAGQTDTPRSWGVSAPESIWEAVPHAGE